ncbi:MAG: Bug family tripartite tricarboxylate transporter substrate binding protein, partial [Pollutimonas bauzanensis]
NGPLLFSPLIFKRQAYEWNKDFKPISSVSLTPMVLQVNPKLPAKTFQDLIALAKKSPGDLNMASPGAGTSNHLMSELLQELAGARWTTIHYKGNAPATTDLLGGQVDFNFDQVSVALPFIQQGKLRALAVTSEKRVPSLPDVPTFQEAGVKDMVAYTFTGLLAPKGTPQDVIDRLSAALQGILSQPDVIKKFETLGAEARGMAPAAFTQYISREDQRWTPIIKKAGITAQ